MKTINNDLSKRLYLIKDSLIEGSNIINGNDIVDMNNLAIEFINTNAVSDTMKQDIYTTLVISNILYNNTTKEVLPLEDGVYDLVVAKYNNLFNGEAPVGAPPTKPIKIVSGDNSNPVNVTGNNRVVIARIDRTNKQYISNIMNNNLPFNRMDYYKDTSNTTEVSKITRNIPAKFPELVGTLHKCKFVSLRDAMAVGVQDDDFSVMVFDRDFLAPTFKTAEQCAFNDRIPVEMIAELKYDGMSVEAEIENDTIISANSRGDTANNIATDLTEIFGGKKFYRAKDYKKFFGGRETTRFGMKFEAIITYSDLAILAEQYGITYKNPRVAVSGIISSKNAKMFRDFITLVPIKTSGLHFNKTSDEINFMNAYYSSGVTMRYAMLHGDFYQILSQVQRFTNEAEYARPYMNFAYDGVVISYTHPALKTILGRKNSIDLWSMAIKFNASSKNAYFLGYTYTVGQDGRVTPMAHFTPVEFFGTIHDKTTIHSFKRFNQLDLRKGDIVNITYMNDVICYLTKPVNSYNEIREGTVPPIEFPSYCPYCGSPIVYSNTGDTAWCSNPNCSERVLNKVVNMLKKLNIKDFGESYIRKLGVTNLTELLNLSRKDILDRIGSDVMTDKLLERINEIRTKGWYDYQIIGAIGFTSISASRWKLILTQIPLETIVHGTPIGNTDSNLYNMIRCIKGIGNVIARTIVDERKDLLVDLNTIEQMPNIVRSYGLKQDNGIQIRFSGVRDARLEEQLKNAGYDCDSKKGVTNKTNVLIVPYLGFTSSKVTKAMQHNIRIMPIADAESMLLSNN